jgi:hypothetical protein
MTCPLWDTIFLHYCITALDRDIFEWRRVDVEVDIGCARAVYMSEGGRGREREEGGRRMSVPASTPYLLT